MLRRATFIPERVSVITNLVSLTLLKETLKDVLGGALWTNGTDLQKEKGFVRRGMHTTIYHRCNHTYDFSERLRLVCNILCLEEYCE